MCRERQSATPRNKTKCEGIGRAQQMASMESYRGLEWKAFLCRAYSVSGLGSPAALTGRRMRREFPASSRRGMSHTDDSSFHCARRSTLDTSSGGTKFEITTCNTLTHDGWDEYFRLKRMYKKWSMRDLLLCHLD